MQFLWKWLSNIIQHDNKLHGIMINKEKSEVIEKTTKTLKFL